MTAPGSSTQTIIAGMGELRVVTCAAGERVFLKTTVGSCIGLFVADVENRVFGIAHIMLPAPLKDDDALGKYADTALPELIRLMSDGGRRLRIKAYVVGGASMFVTESHSFVGDIGRRNVEAVRAATERHGVPVVFEDTGGNNGRTVIYDCSNDTINVRTLVNPGFIVSGANRE